LLLIVVTLKIPVFFDVTPCQLADRFCVSEDCSAFRTVIFWVITQGVVVILTDVSGQPIFRDQESMALDKMFYYFLFKLKT
jgi:hypothetical protein